ncbi:8479_t:CDS:2, partial [Scutellospora calospora]
SSRAKYRYLRITAIWIMPNFKIKDVILENKYVPSSNTIIAFSLLNQKDRCDKIKRLSCIAYTLQLAIRKGLVLAKILVVYTRKLIQFFQSPKQIERLE